MTTRRSFSLGRRGEAQWQRLRAAYILSQSSGEIVLVASDSQDVRDEIRRRLEAMSPCVEVIAPSEGVTLAIHELARSRTKEEKLPVAWIEAPASSPSPESDMRWIEALVVLNQTRDALRMHGPCHVVLAGPRALHRVVATRAPDVTSFMAIMLLLDDTLEELVTQQGTLTWLHLSDLHVQSESWQHDHVLGALVRDLPELLEERELRPDLVFVTGDVAARGQRTEYDGAAHLLEELAERLGIDRRQQVLVVSGNHDVDRGKIGRLATRDHAALLALSGKDLRDAVGELLGDANQFRLYGERLEEWCAFTDTLLGRARSVSVDRPWRSDVIDVRGLPIGVLSLCTVWASGPDDREGSLILGERQINDMVAEVRDGGAQLTIALMHHPLRWLHDGERSAIRSLLERDTDVVLHGHVHDAQVAMHVAARSAHVEIGAGAAYAGLDEDPYHGFSVGRLDIAEGRLDMHCFTWSTESGRWHPTTRVPGADDQGRLSFAFSPAALAPEATRLSGHEVLATRLRNAAAKEYARVDFAGLRAGGPRKHVTLEQIFVPLRLAAKGLASPDASWFEGNTEEEIVFERGDPDEDIPVDAPEAWRGRYDAPEGGIVDSSMRGSGRVTLSGLDAMLAEGRKIVVLGGPGSGKSTLAKYIASTTAQREGGAVPLLLTVRDWIAEGRREHLLDMAVRQAGTSLSVRTSREALEALCERGRVVLIVDGVDEAADEAVRLELCSQVNDFVKRFPRVPVLVTSRIAGYDRKKSLDENVFGQLTLEPFDDYALEQFVRRWYDLVEDDPAVRLHKRVDLLHALDVEPRTRELARNPLLATLMGMVHFSHAHLPGDRAKLYGLMIDLLLITWPAERKRELPELHGAVQQPMLEKLALRIQEQRVSAKDSQVRAEVLVEIEQLDSMLEELLAERFREQSAPERRYLVRKWSKWLVDACGLLQEQLPGRVGFLHLSLMEYMAGRALLERSLRGGYEAVAELVATRHDQPVWRETLLLMLGGESKKRELGQVVVESLLALDPGAASAWTTCVFELALLREEVDMGELRERLLEHVCRTAATVTPDDWTDASLQCSDILRFSQVHRAATLLWLRNAIREATGDTLVGALALTNGVLSVHIVEESLSGRNDLESVIPLLADFGHDHPVGRWARKHVTPDLWFAWANDTPLEGVLARSFETHTAAMPCSVWIPAFFKRGKWISQVTNAAAAKLQGSARDDGGRGLPSAVSWSFGRVTVRSHLDVSLLGVPDDRPEPRLTFSRKYAYEFAREYAENYARGLALQLGMSFPLPSSQEFAVEFARYYARYFALSVDQHIGRAFARYFTQDFVEGFSQYFSTWPILDFSHGVHFQVGSQPGFTAAQGLWSELRAATTNIEARLPATGLLLSLIGEGWVALVNSSIGESAEIIDTLATLRIQNRRLNLFYDAIVGTCIDLHPGSLPPDLHALLLTYGLVQYQTTWEWPDCPHWRSWFAGDAPAHWLPAHVWHLVRSIQDPANPTQRDLASAALDRNDWPELAQALRENTLVPTPPEVLALFDHGNDTQPPSSH